MQQTMIIQRVEGLAIAVASMVLAVAFEDVRWWWLLALFAAIDVTAAGYLLNPRIGAVVYNAGHTLVWPAGFGCWALLGDVRWPLVLALAWAFHIGVDRAIGYGFRIPGHGGSTTLGTPPLCRSVARLLRDE